MMEVINKMIFPAPDASYSITTRNPGARLVHIRRPNNSQRFTVGYYLSPTLARLDSQKKGKPSSPTTTTDNSNNSCVDDDNATLVSEASRGRYSDLEKGRAPPSHLLLYAHPNACDIAMLLQELQYVSGVCNVDVLIWEFRGYGMCGAGDSGVEPSEIDLYRDMEATFEFAINTLGFPANRIILSGRSIGTGPSVQLASYLPPKFRRNASKEEVAAGGGPLAGVFLQCPFTSIQDGVDSLIDINATKYTKGLFSGSIKSVARSVVSDRFRSIDSIEHLFWPREEVTASSSASSMTALNASVSRLVLQHGSDDTIVPNTHSIALVEKVRARLAKQLGLPYPFPQSSGGASSSSAPSTTTEPAFNLMGRDYDGGKSDAAAAAAASKISPEEATLKEALEELLHLEMCPHEGHNDLSVETMAELLSEYIVDPSNIQLSRTATTPTTTPPPPFTHIDVLLRLESYCVGPSFFWQLYAVDEGANGNAEGNTEADESSLTTLGEWTHSILPRVIPNMGDTLRRIGGPTPTATSNPPNPSTPTSSPHPLLLQDACRIDPTTQRQLSQVMTASISAFMNHAAIRWLRAKRLTKLRQLIASRPDRAEKYKGVVAMISEYYNAVPHHSSDSPNDDDDGATTTTSPTPNNSSNNNPPVGGGAPLSDSSESRARRGAPLVETASLAGKTKDLTTGFILEHIALYGNPLGIYLLPNLERGPSSPPSSSSSPQTTTSSNPNVVVFGSLINADSMKGITSDSTTAVPYRSWYTHTVFDNHTTATATTTADTEATTTTSSSSSAPAVVSSPTFASSKKMKRLTERLPRVPLFECEMSNNLMVLIKSFLDSLEVAESGLESLNEFELNDLCGVVAVEKTALRLSERQVDKIQMECERIVLALMEEDTKEAATTTNSSSSVLSTLLKPIARLLFSKKSGGEDGLLTDLYLPNDLYTETLPMPVVLPCRLLSALDSDFSREYFSLTGDLEAVVKEVESRLAKLVNESSSAVPKPVGGGAVVDDNDGSDEKLQGASQDSYAALLFTLQGALLRNSPESLVGAVGDTSHHPTFLAVRLLTTIYYRHYLPNEAIRSSPSTLHTFHSTSTALLKNSSSTSTHQFVNRVYVPAMVGGSGADVLRYVRAQRKESLNDPEMDALLYIKPGGKTSAAGSGDCIIM